MNNTFKRLKIDNWKQFEALDVSFHPNLTILTGANGSGKTTVLNMLSRHFGWNFLELATPAKDKQSGGFTFFKRWFTASKTENQLGHVIGQIFYSNSINSSITLPVEQPGMPIVNPMSNPAQYHLQFSQFQRVEGLHIPSHRPVFSYQTVNSVPTQKRTNEQAFQLSHQWNVGRFNGGHGLGNINFVIKETLIGWAIAGAGNRFIESDIELEENYLGFQEILKKVLPQSLGFQELSIRNFEVILVTESGEFMIDGASGGVSAIIDLAWQIYNYNRASPTGCVVLIDEVENHLHPSMQRSILPDFISAFPKVQFIVTTHSPLIVGSVKDSHIYALRYNEYKRIYSELLDIENKAHTATEILNEVLEVPVTMPIWVERKLNQIIEQFSNTTLTDSSLAELRSDLKEFGFEKYIPESINLILGANDKTN